jgi:hypothetical protein
MNNELAQHPAVQFGAWLKSQRRECGVVARVFAGRIGLSPAEYTEVESGVIRWIEDKQERLIPLMLNLDEVSEAEFNQKLYLAREHSRLEFSDLFLRDQLAPARCSTSGDKQIDEKTREDILKAVFAPLS